MSLEELDDTVPTPPLQSETDQEPTNPDDQSEEDSVKTDARLWYTAPKINVTFNPYLPDPHAGADPFRLCGLGTTLKGFEKFIDANQNARVTDGAELAQWRITAETAVETAFFVKDGLEAAAIRETAAWTQVPTFQGTQLVASIPRLKADNKGTGILTGEKAIQKITGLLSPLGTTLSVPCWHTGIWLTLRTPTLAALVELDQRLAAEKILLGRATRGLVFSNESVAVNKHLVEFILAHCIDSSFRPLEPDQIAKVLKLPDLGVIATFMAATIYMRGFPYSFSCTVDLENCTHVSKELLSLTKLLWVDTAQLTEKQLKQMASPTPKVRHTQADVDAYQAEWRTVPSGVLEINESVSLVFRLPTIDEHVQSGYRWVDDLVQATEAAFGQSLTANERSQYLMAQARATSVRRYSHWIEKAIVTELIDGEPTQSFVEDEETLSNLYVKFSSVSEISEKITDAIGNFINDRTMAIIAIPNESCPNCGKFHLSVDGPMGHLIPLDAVSTFFHVLRLHLQKNI